eukprot:TRINITY_DN4383_c0_g1_i1.p1 TRINITY_DN4383_c0_g1~~TRINITY_DN4383_c0_g1_i1.p1  ORF type:complete len:346 (+),score=70.72 TRINITY_DN4383_c0_g1_i1:76-1113(+)
MSGLPSSSSLSLALFSFSRLYRHFIFVIIFFTLSCSLPHTLMAVSAHAIERNAKPFSIAVDSKNSISITSTSLINENECTFTYSTRTVVVAPSPIAIQGKRSDENALSTLLRGPLSGTCATKTEDYWAYEVCVGSSIRQFRDADQYFLGKTSKIFSPISEVYDAGTVCQALPSKAPRKTTVKYVCRPSQVGLAILSVSEVSMCTYEIVLASKVFCEYAIFPEVDESAISAPVVESDSEDWLMQISQLADGRSMCTVSSNEYRPYGSKLAFHDFELTLIRTGKTVAHDTVPYQARHHGRTEFDPNEVKYTYAFNSSHCWSSLSTAASTSSTDVRNNMGVAFLRVIS